MNRYDRASKDKTIKILIRGRFPPLSQKHGGGLQSAVLTLMPTIARIGLTAVSLWVWGLQVNSARDELPDCKKIYKMEMCSARGVEFYRSLNLCPGEAPLSDKP